jgi:hypothetical protein
MKGRKYRCDYCGENVDVEDLISFKYNDGLGVGVAYMCKKCLHKK